MDASECQRCRSVARAILLLMAFSVAGARNGIAAEPLAEVDNPASEGWETEVLQAASTQQLTKLAELLVSGDVISPNDLSDIITRDFTCSALRPAHQETAFADRQLETWRTSSETETRERCSGAVGLARALNELRPRGMLKGRAKAKAFRISLIAGGFRTKQIFSMFSESKGGGREVHAIWRCNWTMSSPRALPRLRSIDVEDYEETRLQGTDKRLFSDCSVSVLGKNAAYCEQLCHGTDYWSDRLLKVPLEGTHGLAVGDINGDGLDDVYVCSSASLPNRLFVQNVDGTATDRSAEAGVDWHESSHGALFIDLDNDGDQDLVVSTRPALLTMENDGGGRFTLRSSIAAARNAYSLSAADYDNDGDLDVFACVYYHAQVRNRDILAIPVPFYDAKNGGRNVLLRNDGAWQLRDVTREAGLEPEATRLTLASSWEDYDNDGDQDLYVANDYGRNNLFRNEAGHFTDVAGTAGVEDQSFGMSVSWSDFNRDGWMDLYVANMFSSAGNRIAFQQQFRAHDSDNVRHQLQYMARGNSLFQNLGNGHFSDVSAPSATMMGYWSWGSKFVDLNNDGHEDIIVANGFLTRAESTNDL